MKVSVIAATALLLLLGGTSASKRDMVDKIFNQYRIDEIRASAKTWTPRNLEEHPFKDFNDDQLMKKFGLLQGQKTNLAGFKEGFHMAKSAGLFRTITDALLPEKKKRLAAADSFDART